MPTFSPRGHEVVDRLVRDLGARAHQHDHALGLRVADVVEELVGAAGALAEAGHRLLDDPGAGQVEAVAGLAGLEEDVGVLRGAAQDRLVRGEGALAVRGHEVVAHHEAQVVVLEQLDLADLVRGAEAVEEVEEGHPRLEGRGVGDEGEVVGLLDGARGEQGEAGLAAGHHVGVVAEDREGVGGHGARGDVHRERR